VTFAQGAGADEMGGVLSAGKLNVVQTHGSVFVRRFCMHCDDPPAHPSVRWAHFKRRRRVPSFIRKIAALAAGIA